MSHDHDHDHDGHDHDHDDHAEPLASPVPAAALRARAIEQLLVEKGVLTRETVVRGIDWLVSRTPTNGARIVARAWVDPAYKARLLADAKAAAAELGIDAAPSAHIIALENTDDLHHLVVCTLCSCYPRALLGPPPAWYKSNEYRSRAVVEPRAVMAEFGLRVPDAREVRVVDSTADVRYLVIPRRPAGTDGWSEERLAALVSRDSLVGVVDPLEPDLVSAA